MLRPRSAATALLAAIAAPAQAQLPDGFCHDLRRIVRSATEREVFGSVTYHETWARFTLMETCRPNRLGPVDRVLCIGRLPSTTPVTEAIVGEALRCLPGAARDNSGGPGGLAEAQARLTLNGLSIYLGQDISAPGVLSNTFYVSVILGDE